MEMFGLDNVVHGQSLV